MKKNKSKKIVDIDKINTLMKTNKFLKTQREMFILSLMKFTNYTSIIANKLNITKDFIDRHIKLHNLNKENSKLEKEQYNFFLKLKKHEIIHEKSSHYNMKKSFISINPNPTFIYNVKLSDVDVFLDTKEELYNTPNIVFANHKKQLVYIDLRIYQDIPLSDKEMGKINIKDIIYLNDQQALLYFEYTILTHQTPSPYYLIPIEGRQIISYFKYCEETNQEIPFCDKQLETEFIKYKKQNFGNKHISYLKMLNKNNVFFQTTPLSSIIKTSRNIISPLTIAEIDYLYPGTVPSHLKKGEEERIKKALKRPNQDNEDEDDLFKFSEFRLKNFESLKKLRKISYTDKKEFFKTIPSVKQELEKYLQLPDSSQHSKMIVQYILYLLERIDSKHEIRISTFKGYLGQLDKHLFQKISNLNDIQPHEINQIFDNLIRLQYKHKSIKKIRSLIISFFKFHSQKLNINFLSDTTYPKSLVFDDEIDDILREIELEEKKLIDRRALSRTKKSHEKSILTRMGSRVKFAILQKQALILSAYYFGMRKTELKSRLKSDVSSNIGYVCIEINKDGMKKIKLNLKTKNARRRVCSHILNEKHLNILEEFWKLRGKIKNKSPFAFLKVTKDYTITSKPISESVFNELNHYIQTVTKRYTSFHSLRHSYISNESLKILNGFYENIYSPIDLSIKIGHESPEMSFKAYVHASLLLCKIKEDSHD